MIPDFTSDGTLPPGIHWATWSDIEVRFGTTLHRRRLLSGLFRAACALRDAGCRVIYVDGSFVTDKEVPNDFDGCWDANGVDPDLLDPILLAFSGDRAAQKAKYLGELIPAQTLEINSQSYFLEFFQKDRHTGNRKGIVAIDLAALPATPGGVP
jgi:hypothetical protein